MEKKMQGHDPEACSRGVSDTELSLLAAPSNLSGPRRKIIPFSRTSPSVWSRHPHAKGLDESRGFRGNSKRTGLHH